MKNETQLERYKRLISYIDEKFKEDIDIEKVEQISLYSYRNINRIFLALHNETIGKYIKRLRLEKAAQYLKYSDSSISDIAFEVGFEDIAAFSKAFKNRFACTPTAFRQSSEKVFQMIHQALDSDSETEQQKLPFVIEFLPDFEFLCLEYRGDYEDFAAIKKYWQLLLEYANQKNVLTDDSIFMAQILDDGEISDLVHCRFNVAIILERSLTFVPEGLFKVQKHRRQKYVKFIHKGAHELSSETYHKIYTCWMQDVQLELADLPTLEFCSAIHSCWS